MFKIFRIILTITLMFFMSFNVFGKRKSKLAVMEVKDESNKISTNTLKSITTMLRVNLGETGKYIIIDGSRQKNALKDLIKKGKKESYQRMLR